MIEIIIVCTALMCPEDFTPYAVPMPRGATFSSYSLSQPGGWLRPFCFINAGDAGGYVRVIEWTDRVVRVEASEGIRRCSGQTS